MPIFRYQCGKCNDHYDTLLDAKDCCPPIIHELYLCVICDEDFANEESAARCEAEHAAEDDTEEV